MSAQASSQFSLQCQSFLRNNLSVLQKNINMSSSQSRNTFSTTLGNAQAISENDANESLLAFIEEISLDSTVPIVKMNAMCILYHHLFGNLDYKLFAAVIDYNKKVFLCRHCIFCIFKSQRNFFSLWSIKLNNKIHFL